MKNIEQILSMVNQVSKDYDWQAFEFFCSGKYCRLVNKEEENHIELWIEYELVGTITEVWTDDGEWYDEIRVFDESWEDFFNENAECMCKYVICTRSEEVPDPT